MAKPIRPDEQVLAYLKALGRLQTERNRLRVPAPGGREMEPFDEAQKAFRKETENVRIGRPPDFGRQPPDPGQWGLPGFPFFGPVVPSPYRFQPSVARICNLNVTETLSNYTFYSENAGNATSQEDPDKSVFAEIVAWANAVPYVASRAVFGFITPISIRAASGETTLQINSVCRPGNFWNDAMTNYQDTYCALGADYHLILFLDGVMTVLPPNHFFDLSAANGESRDFLGYMPIQVVSMAAAAAPGADRYAYVQEFIEVNGVATTGGTGSARVDISFVADWSALEVSMYEGCRAYFWNRQRRG